MEQEKLARRWGGWTVSSSGYRVRILGRNQLQYEDEFGQQQAFVEPGSGNAWKSIVVETTALADRPERSRGETVDRIRRVFEFRGWTFVEASH